MFTKANADNYRDTRYFSGTQELVTYCNKKPYIF